MFEKQIKKEVRKQISMRYGLIRNVVEDYVEFFSSSPSFEVRCRSALVKILIENDDIMKPFIDSKMKEAAIKAVKSDVMKICIEAASEVISGEEFINSVVKRINEKQVVKQ